MRSIICLLSLIAAASALPAPDSEASVALFTVELAFGETRKVTEAGKAELIEKGIHFIDVTEWTERSNFRTSKTSVMYPETMSQVTSTEELIAGLDRARMKRNLEMFSSFTNRYYGSTTGNLSAEWLFGQAKGYIPANSSVSVSLFENKLRQSSIIAKIPGKSQKTIVVGAHQDSINAAIGTNRTIASAPGADDNGSGTMTILEAFRALLSYQTIVNGEAENTIEFHWYAGEEVGLVGSSNIFWSYSDEGRDVVAMLNQDMTGYTGGYTSRNMTPKFGVVTDYTDASLTSFVRRIISTYTDTEGADTKCGYACSDHVSAMRAGYPSAFVFEGEMHTVNDYPYIHSEQDTVDKVDFGHMIEHAKLVVGFVVELAFATL